MIKRSKAEWRQYFIEWAAGSLDAGDLQDAGIEPSEYTDAELDKIEDAKRQAAVRMFRLTARRNR